MTKHSDGTWTDEIATPQGTKGAMIDPSKEPGVNIVGEGSQVRIALTGAAIERLWERARGDTS